LRLVLRGHVARADARILFAHRPDAGIIRGAPRQRARLRDGPGQVTAKFFAAVAQEQSNIRATDEIDPAKGGL
jgi:hypothetical protein